MAAAVRRIAGFSLTTADAPRLLDFYLSALGCRLGRSERRSGDAFATLMGVRGGAQSHRLNLGEGRIELLQFDQPGKAYPAAASAEDNTFQHFAIVVSDMQRAFARLARVSGWRPISTSGPQLLPASSGGVTAFKFRDPDGHPLELLEFPADRLPVHWRVQPADQVFLGIDHSAISVTDTGRSIAFYRSLGLQVTAQTQNHGAEQAHLDGVESPQVEVTALMPPQSTPHLELLCYRTSRLRDRVSMSNNDVVATRLMLEIGAPQGSPEMPEHIDIDPDGHHLHFGVRCGGHPGQESQQLQE